MAGKLTLFLKTLIGAGPNEDTKTAAEHLHEAGCILKDRLMKISWDGLTRIMSSGSTTHTTYTCDEEYRRHLTEVSEAQTEYNRRYRRLQDCAYELNKRLPISKLPVEVLSLIFHFIRMYPDITDEVSLANFHPLNHRTLEWVFITWVCRHWRNVAINDASLWVHIPQVSPQWTLASLERSRNAGLDVDFDQCDDFGTGIEAILTHSSHIAKIELSFGLLERTCRKFSLSSVPRLRDLRIWRHDEYGPAMRLPSNVFVDSNNLSRLDLNNVIVSWDSHLLSSSLCELKLHNCPPLTWRQFKSVIARMPHLETLKLSLTLPQDQPSHDDEKIILQSLKNLHLGEAIPAILNFFDIVSLVPQVYGRVFLGTSLPKDSRQNLLSLLSCLQRAHVIGGRISVSNYAKFSNLPRPDSDALFMTVGIFYGADKSNSEDGLHTTITLVQKYENGQSIQSRHNAIHNIFADTFSHFRWSNLADLDLVHLDSIVSPETFGLTLARTFGTLDSLQSVRVGNTCARPLMDALTMLHPHVDNTDEDTRRLTFKALSRLYMEGVMFAENPDDAEYMAVDPWDLLENVRTRHFTTLATSILRITFINCEGLTRHQVRQFNEVGDLACWDEDLGFGAD